MKKGIGGGRHLFHGLYWGLPGLGRRRRGTLSPGQGTLASAEPFPPSPKAAGQRFLGVRYFSPLGASLLFSLVITICQSLFSTDSPQLRNSRHTAFPGKAGSSGAVLCSGLVKMNCRVTQGLHSHCKFGESLNWGLGCEGTRHVSVEREKPANAGAGEWVYSPLDGGTR